MKKLTLPAFTLLFFSGFFIPSLHAQDFYKGIQEVRITLPHIDWDDKLDSLKNNNPEARLAGQCLIAGQKFDSIGIRYKGNSSYFRTRKDTYKKLPFNIKLDYKIKSQRIAGAHTSVKLSNAFLDPSFIRDPLAYEVIRQYMPAPECNFARVYVNTTFYGLYVNTESIDEAFVQKHFQTDKGYLIKCDPDNWKRVRSQTGCPKGENASLAYLNDSAGCYDSFYEVDTAAAWKPLLRLIKVLNKTPDKIEQVLDVDQTLWMLALNNTLVNLDSYNGSLSHNYYLWFDTTGVAHPLIWDLNMAFGGWRRNFSFELMTDDDLIQYQPLAEINNVKRPLISKLLTNPLYRKIYLAHMRTIVKDNLTSGTLMKRAEVMMKEIDPWVKLDSMKLYSYTEFQQSMNKTMENGPDKVIGLRQLMDKRGEWLQKHPLLTKTAPVISEVKHVQQGEKWLITAKTGDAKSSWLFYRNNPAFAFKRTAMFDDGTHGDVAAGDGVFTNEVEAVSITHYYIAADNDEAASLFPEKASHDFLKIQ